VTNLERSGFRVKHNIKDELQGALVFIGALWVVFLVTLVVPSLKSYGLVPRDLSGSLGILTMPFLHSGVAHLVGNTLPLLALLLLLAGSRANSWRIVAGTAVLGGLLLWLFGRTANHIGASGLVFGLVAFLIASGVLEKRLIPLLITVIVGFLFGGTLLSGILPTAGPEVSWDGHLFGAVAGVAMAYGLVAGNRKRLAVTER